MVSPLKSPMFVHPECVLASDCERIRAAMDAAAASPAEIYHTDDCRIDEDARRALEIEVADEVVDEVQRVVDRVRLAVAQCFGVALSGHEGPGFVRYMLGGFYRRHCDVLSDSGDEFPRRIALVMFLTSAGEQCEGGTLRIYRPEAFDIVPKAGTLVAFPADVPHEVLPVTGGVRDVVVDWFF
jgi:predicted 2-oxoglutarate/Fe(II)-dependent dioxygenase YbiX